MSSLIGDNLKIGVIGTGRWGKKHIDEYSKMKDVRLSWISDLSQENLDETKEKYNIENTSIDYQEVLSSDVEAISICSSNESHYKICKDALIAGKDVLVEKPLTIIPKKAYELVKIAKEQKRLLAVGHLFRYNNSIKEVKRLIQEGYLGKIYYLRLQWTIQWMPEMYPDKKLDIIVDMMPHLYDIMNYLTEKWPKKITCYAKSYTKKEFEDTAYVYCEFPENIMTHSEISWTLPEKVREVDVIGQKASAKIQAVTQKVKVFEGSNEGRTIDIKENNTLGEELREFIEAVKNKKDVTNNGEIGAKTVELVDATKRSLEQKRPIIL
jgi:predicted dehydrogenase